MKKNAIIKGTKPLWQSTKVANLIRYIPSKTYYARVRVRGKLICKCLNTSVFSVAQVRLPDFVKEQRGLAEARLVTVGKLSFGAALEEYRKEVEQDTRLKPSAKLYRQKTIDGLLNTWPGIKDREIKAITEAECLAWAKKYHEEYSPSVFNNTVGTLRNVFKVGINVRGGGNRSQNWRLGKGRGVWL